MKTTVQILCLLVLSMLLTGMAQAGSLNNKGLKLKKVKATTVGAVTKVEGLETYYGETFSVTDVAGISAATSISNIVNSGEIRLRSGQVFTKEEIEYAYVPRTRRAGSTTVTVGTTGKAPHEKAPHEKAPHEQN